MASVCIYTLGVTVPSLHRESIDRCTNCTCIVHCDKVQDFSLVVAHLAFLIMIQEILYTFQQN